MIAWIVEALIASSLLMLLVLVLRDPVRRAFGPSVAYALWALPVLRLFLPPLPGDWRLSQLIAPAVSGMSDSGVAVGVLNPAHLSLELARQSILDAKIAMAHGPVEIAVLPPVATPQGPSIAVLVGALWLVGAVAFLAYHLVSHSRFCARVHAQARRKRLVADGRVTVIETAATSGPLAFGIWRKYVAFPRDFAERYDPVERNLALAHELTHHQRGDLVANWVALAMLALHWFNPLAWRAFKAFRADQEMACDAYVLAGRAPDLRHAYGRAIVKSAHGGAVSAACHLHTINDIKGRLKMLTKHRKMTRGQLVGGTLSLTTLAMAGLFVTASGTAAAERVRERVSATIGADLTRLSAVALQSAPPAPPAPAAAPEATEAPEAPEAPEKIKKIERRFVVVRTPEGEEHTTFMTMDGKDIAELRKLADSAALKAVDAERLAREVERNLPEIVERDCGKGKAPVIHLQTGEGGAKKPATIICKDRIEWMAKDAAGKAERTRVFALNSARMGIQSAMWGLKHARNTIEHQSELSEEQRREALAGIDQALKELQAEKIDGDED
ncbi:MULTISPECIES: M56 family metallopeptidase [unclassified Sphingomonas]|uniref:M56 family metallopeptidase n=3 Tax=Sphingomonas TaxID=13687 RepID=UPI00083306AA|nr:MULTISPECIES: M56 family metallopeptidase [unclassified Sphingomonas]